LQSPLLGAENWNSLFYSGRITRLILQSPLLGAENWNRIEITWTGFFLNCSPLCWGLRIETFYILAYRLIILIAVPFVGGWELKRPGSISCCSQIDIAVPFVGGWELKLAYPPYYGLLIQLQSPLLGAENWNYNCKMKKTNFKDCSPLCWGLRIETAVAGSLLSCHSLQSPLLGAENWNFNII